MCIIKSIQFLVSKAFIFFGKNLLVGFVKLTVTKIAPTLAETARIEIKFPFLLQVD